MNREVTNKLLHMMDDGLISAKVLAEACLMYMSEADVVDMAHCNELLCNDEEEIDYAFYNNLNNLNQMNKGRALEDFDMNTKALDE